jgi:hypothetical protein
MKKVSKPSVNYRPGTPRRHCGNCAMFHPRSRSCDLVSGQISAEDVCDKWVKK